MPTSTPAASLAPEESRHVIESTGAEGSQISEKDRVPSLAEPFFNFSFQDEKVAEDENVSQGMVDPRDNIIFCREKLFMRKDSYLYFVSTENLTTGEPRIIKANKRMHFVVPLRGESRNSLVQL